MYVQTGKFSASLGDFIPQKKKKKGGGRGATQGGEQY